MTKTLIIYGPTVTGKTALATSLAKKFNGELISADSRQVYRGLDIGTGKVSFESQVEKHNGYWIVDGVKIHGFDLVNLPSHEPGSQHETFTVADFLESTSTTLIRIDEVKKLPIIVGGTGFYIKALIDGIGSIGTPADQQLRNRLEKLSVHELYQKLYHINPDRAVAMNESDRANPRRLIRAIEIAVMSNANRSHSGVATCLPAGRTTTIEPRSLGPQSQVHRGTRTASYAYRSVPLRSRMTRKELLIGLTAPNFYLYQRADQWFRVRLEHGMLDEVKNLLDRKVDPVWLDNLGLEYRWLTRSLLGKIDQNLAIERLKGDIHSLIRRQKTWFKKFKNIQLFDISQPSWQDEVETTVKDWYTKGK